MNKEEKLTDILQKVDRGQMDIAVAFDQILRLFSVSGSFSQKDMENFAAKCMTLGHGGKTTKELLQDFCDNDR